MTGDDRPWWAKEGYTSEENALADREAFWQLVGRLVPAPAARTWTRYRLDGWRPIEDLSGYELRSRFDRELERLTDDLRVCGQGYPSPRREVIRQIALEQARREARR